MREDVKDSDLEEAYPVKVVKKSSMKLKLVSIVVCFCLLSLVVAVPIMVAKNRDTDSSENEVVSYDFPFASRSEWHARTPIDIQPLTTPVPYVVIHHSYTPPACYSAEECGKAMRSMQDFHMDGHKWWDIGYNFAVGGDGVAYEGRGWRRLGAHALHFNTVSIGICVIGDWTTSVPPANQLKIVQALISAGVELGYIKPDYKLVGHRQVRATECPGQSFYEEIKKWNHYAKFPASADDLIHVPELQNNNKTITNKL